MKIVESAKTLGTIGEGIVPSKTITVSGSGFVLATPDIADVSFSVNADATTAAAAQSKAASSTNAAIAAVKAGGVADADIQTSGYSLSPKYEYVYGTATVCPANYPCPPQQNQKLVGYTVTESIEVKIRNLDSVGSILSTLGTLGVTNIYGPNFITEDPTQLQDQARAKAIADAKTRAQALTNALGVHLGKVVSFSEGSSPIYYPMAETASSGAAKGSVTPNLPTGQTKITENVSVTYEIK